MRRLTSASATFARDGHDIEIGDLKNGRRRLIGVQRLSFSGRHGRDCARHRRVDLGEPEIRAVALKVGFGLLNLRRDGLDLGFGHGRLRFAFLQYLLADRIDGDQVLIALQVLFSQCQLGFLLIELRLEAVDACLVCLHLCLVDTRVDLGKQFAFGHRITDIDMDLLDLPRYLRPDIHVLLCLQLPLCGNDFLYGSAGNGDGAKGIALRFLRRCVPVTASRDEARHNQESNYLISSCFRWADVPFHIGSPFP